MTFSAICVYSGVFIMVVTFCIMMMPPTPDLHPSNVAAQAKKSTHASSSDGVHHTRTCRRCNGSGLWMDLPNYTCFRCNGSGIDPN